MLWGWSCAKKIKDVRLFFYAHSITLIRHINNFGSEGNVLLITMSEHHSLRLRHIKGLLEKKKKTVAVFSIWKGKAHFHLTLFLCELNTSTQRCVCLQVQGEREKKLLDLTLSVATGRRLNSTAHEHLSTAVCFLFKPFCTCLGDWLLSFTGVCVGVLCVYVGFGSKGLNPLFEIMHNRESQLF